MDITDRHLLILHITAALVWIAGGVATVVTGDPAQGARFRG